MPVTPDLRFADCFSVRLESSNGQSWILHGRCSLGRGPENDIIIDSPKASRKHAFIHPQDDEYWLVDNHSRNGTYRNDKRVVRPTHLRHGDRLNIGGQNFVFHQPKSSRPHDADPTSISHSGTGDATVLDLRSQNVWLLIADIKNFTELSRTMDVEKLAEIMGHWLKACQGIVEKGVGRFAKYLGDGFLACWEERSEVTPSVVQALRDFQELQGNSPVTFRVALHYGMVTFGEQSAWGEPSILGPEMNFIFRLEDLASKLGLSICLSSPAQARLSGLIPIEAVPGEHALKGYEGTHRCYRVPKIP